ncbi:MAG: DUF4199 domain-containing protein [Tannerellaceae bacterium]|nr:DUF4199 domain-containing protein [Tannerellaceae bacterium]
MDNKELLLKSAMFYGLLLGIFWVVKYLFFIWGATNPSISVVYWVLTPITIVFAYIFTKVYKIQIGGCIRFSHAWQFGILLYFFAALIVSLLHYVFYRYLAPPDYLANAVGMAMDMIRDINPEMAETMPETPVFTPIRMTIQGILNNVLYGILFSLPIAAILCRNREDMVYNQE